MIPQPAIKKWQESFPWQKDYQIEQDLIICRAVCALFSDEYLSEHLAFRGGTTLHKLYLHPQHRWFSGSCKATTYHLEELLGTKLRALYQRRKGRDLFDLWKALSTQNLNIENIILCYREYMSFVVDNPPTQKEYWINMEEKIKDEEFLGDTEMLLRSNEKYNPVEAWNLVRTLLIEKL